MKDRIRLLMESQHMNQQSFASYIGIAPATLSSILQERTRPTLQTVESICKKIPNINLTWLINGIGEMFVSSENNNGSSSLDPETSSFPSAVPQESQQVLDFGYDEPVAASLPSRQASQQRQQQMSRQMSLQSTINMKNIDKQNRKITEIRVFYDDQTWESFVPKK